MSGNAPDPRQKPDKRAARTRDRLGDALVALLIEKSFDSITVQDVLDRAGVARSTFYQHFKDKDDLLLGDADEFFEEFATRLARTDERSERVLPVREFLEHLAHARAFLAALSASGRFHDVMDLGRAHFVRGIELRLAALPRSRAMPATQRALAARALAGAFLALVDHAIERELAEDPAALDDMFHRLVWSGLGPAGRAPLGSIER